MIHNTGHPLGDETLSFLPENKFFHRSPFPMVVLTPDETIERWNKAFESLLGLMSNEEQQEMALYRFILPEDRKLTFRFLKKLVQNPSIPHQFKNRMISSRKGTIRAEWQLFYSKREGRIFGTLKEDGVSIHYPEGEFSTRDQEGKFDEFFSSQKELEEKNKDLTDSIRYAMDIQRSILPSKEKMDEHLGMENFVLFLPKDILAGDLYWTFQKYNRRYFMVGDCTGHGVPGAFLSIMANNAVLRALTEFGMKTPEMILNKLTYLAHEALGNRHDGLDAALCAYLPDEGVVEFSGANSPLFLVRDSGDTDYHGAISSLLIQKDEKELLEIPGDKKPIEGQYISGNFTQHRIPVKSGDIIYLTSDGFQDQFGGPQDKKFKKKNLKRLLLTIHQYPMEEQRAVLERELQKWMSGTEQVDDVCIMGVRIP